MDPTPVELAATAAFALAVLHTFGVKRFADAAHHAPAGSVRGHLLHFLAETEVVFGLWGAALFVAIAALRGSLHDAVAYVDGLSFIEPQFVFVIMVVAATRPIVTLAESLLAALARALPVAGGAPFFVVALAVGPLLGSLITEPAAMTLLALVLKRRCFDAGISRRFAYATLGLLFVNVSIGGTLTHFAAPPVLMVAAKWNWDTAFMLQHFGLRAVASCVASTLLVAFAFRRELAALPRDGAARPRVPPLLTLVHVLFLAAVVLFAHHPPVFFGVFVLFVGVVAATHAWQDELKLREALLVGFFLAGLVVLGAPQVWWLKPLLQKLSGATLFFGAAGLTAFTDNAALTYLGALVEGIAPALQYALVAGAVTGGGLTVIANAPNPAGVGILKHARVFEGTIRPLGLVLGALVPTVVAAICFWLVH